MDEGEFDVVVIGAGAPGEVIAGRLGEAGVSVAIVEERLVGGECSFYACMPSKALLRPVEIRAEAARVKGVARRRRPRRAGRAHAPRRGRPRPRRLVDAPWLTDRGVTLVRGHGRLEGERRVTVGEETLVARKAVVVATGSAAAIPPVPGLAESRPWTNIEATTAKQVPGRLAILGGGVVGVEMAQAWAALGSRVTLVHRGDRLIEREEPFAGDQVADALRDYGVDLRFGTSVAAVARNGVVALELEAGGSLEADELLVAIGRAPAPATSGWRRSGSSPAST